MLPVAAVFVETPFGEKVQETVMNIWEKALRLAECPPGDGNPGEGGAPEIETKNENEADDARREKNRKKWDQNKLRWAAHKAGKPERRVANEGFRVQADLPP